MVFGTVNQIVLVCKFWWEIGTRLLYREVHLRRIGQLATLLSTLEGNARLAETIADINVSCQVTAQYFGVFDKALRRTLVMSPNATRISLRMGVCIAFISSVHQYDLSKTVHLDVGNKLCFWDALPRLPHRKNLVFVRSFLREGLGDIDARTLERLHEWQITMRSDPHLKFLDVIARKWKLPCLRRFTFYDLLCSSQIPHYIKILDAHGKHLTTLSIFARLDSFDGHLLF
ncbi:hypothetical protein EDB19DRAFT_1735898 [Suillus lakei]|nr:hypothetical protein EDB19DRAFT_1735898 [Suillus lakei]